MLFAAVGQRALVIGATGFVGSQVVKCLLEKGYKVRGTCRNVEKAQWLRVALNNPSEENLELKEFVLAPEPPPEDAVMDSLMEGCKSVFMCAGYETQDPTTITFMVNAGKAAVDAASRVIAKNPELADQVSVVLTSSTGSTNKPGAAADSIKSETEDWSDPELQQKNGRFSPAAKTLMEITALKAVGRDQKNELTGDKNEKFPRVCIMNPSLILAPQLKPGDVTSPGLGWFLKIMNGEAMAEKIPNDSMSVIHAADLAKLHVACMENDGSDPNVAAASGRYFGVNKSWHWEDILNAVKVEIPEYKMPAKKYEQRAKETLFDSSRRDSLNIGELKDLQEIVKEIVEFLRKKDLLKI